MIQKPGFIIAAAILAAALMWIMRKGPETPTGLPSSEDVTSISGTVTEINPPPEVMNLRLPLVPGEVAAKAESLPPKVRLLSELIKGRNDNDPRIDSEFKNLSEEDKRGLVEYYGNLRNEDRSGRGTVVFVLGRDIHDVADLDFIENVVAEQPCLSLGDCGVQTASEGTHHEEHDGAADITLAYPQLMALTMIEKQLDKNPGEDMLNGLWRVLNTASKNPNPRVAAKANSILEKTKR